MGVELLRQHFNSVGTYGAPALVRDDGFKVGKELITLIIDCTQILH